MLAEVDSALEKRGVGVDRLAVLVLSVKEVAALCQKVQGSVAEDKIQVSLSPLYLSR